MARVLLSIILTLAMCGSAVAQMGASLVPPSSATDTAKQSGSWQDASTWTDGTVPTIADRVLIPVGLTVTNHATAEALWIHAAGTLTCCDHCDTQINVHTIYVPMGGALQLHSTGKCVVEWLPGPFLPGDATQLSRGMICHGEFMVSGVEKTAWGPVLADLPVGATSLRVAASGWNVGDKLVVTGTDSVLLGLDNSANQHRYQSEFVTVTGIAGDTVTFSPPLKYRHFKWRADLPFHVGNLTRNIVFRSRDTSTIASRGHLMFMSSMVKMANVAVEGCGRTDAMQPVTDPRTDAYGQMVPGSDANVRARYSVHWHRVGQLTPPAICTGCVVDGSPKWGFLNHASNVHMQDCVAVRCNGSGFATEEGQERGSMTRCLSAMNHGMGDVILSSDSDFSRPAIGDFGISGDGFWLQGGLVEVSDCVACDNSGRGFGMFNAPLNGYPRYAVPEYLRFPIEHDGTLLPIEYAGVAKAPSGAVPQRVFARNTAYGNKVGVQCWSSRPDDGSSNIIWPPPIRSSLTDTTLWGRGNVLHLEYARQVNARGVKIVGDSVVHLEGVKQFSTINYHTPIAMRGHHVTVSDLEITAFSDKANYPNPLPIVSVGDGGVTPDHVVESDYPVKAIGYTRN